MLGERDSDESDGDINTSSLLDREKAPVVIGSKSTDALRYCQTCSW